MPTYEVTVLGDPTHQDEELFTSVTVLYGPSNDDIPSDEMHLAEMIAFIQDSWGCLDEWQHTNRRPLNFHNENALRESIRIPCSYCDEYHISPGCFNRPG